MGTDLASSEDARKAVVIVPVSKAAADEYADDALNPFWTEIYDCAVTAFSKLGTLLPDTMAFSLGALSFDERRSMGIDVDFDEVDVWRFTGYVVPNGPAS